MRNRGSVVLIEGNKVALMKRIRAGIIYYVFPGGGIKEGETPELATIRETYEELGVRIKIKNCFATLYDNGRQYYFLAEMIDGQFGTGKGEEFTDWDRNRGIHQPMWIAINQLATLDVRPKEIAHKVRSLLNKE